MSFIKGNLVRKRIGEKFMLGNQEESDIKKFITDETYTTNGEYLLVIKNTQTCRITLDVETTDHIIIKALTDVYIVPKEGLIDEQYSEMQLGSHQPSGCATRVLFGHPAEPFHTNLRQLDGRQPG